MEGELGGSCTGGMLGDQYWINIMGCKCGNTVVFKSKKLLNEIWAMWLHFKILDLEIYIDIFCVKP